MKLYTKTYFAYFGYTTADFIPCELCESRAVDVHHIAARSIAKKLVNEISNLMALCRSCHEKYGDKKQERQKLIETHLKFMNLHGKV